MSTPVETVAIGEAGAGMVLADDLRDDAGAVLLPAGAILSAATLASLRRRGVATLRIAARDAGADGAARQAECERQCQRLERLFRRSAEVGATGQLLERLYAYRRAG